MKYKVHKLEVNKDIAQEKLELFLNSLRGEVVSVVPFVTPALMILGGAAKVSFFLVVEKMR
ncbi:MAG TPA: hypothetical protein PLG08_14960 [Chitinophagaceae bacterium]|nr:hypothetical protein [Chitinophagaceae bacterium]